MKILAIEGSSSVADVALWENGRVLAEFYMDYKKTHSQTLMPLTDMVLKVTQTDPSELDAVAVAKGPGSFTGLRIAAATAKGLAMGLAIPVIGVPTMDAFAMGHATSKDYICPMLDARRSQVYTGIYEFVNMELKVVSAQEIILVEDLVRKLKEYDRRVILIGDGVEPIKAYITENMGDNAVFDISVNDRQRASYVAYLAAEYYARGEYVSAADFVPEYLKETEYVKSGAKA